MGLDLNKKTYFLVTGASRGIGQEIAIRIASKLSEGSLIVLLARNQAGLDHTKKTIQSISTIGLQVLTYSIDLSNVKEKDFHELLMDSLDKANLKSNDFERAFIVHNAGTVGDVTKKASEVADIQQWTSYYHVNVFSAIALNVEFFKRFKGIPKIVINLSSKCAIEPFASMSFYCSGKAAREMYFRVLAVEESEDTLVLNYAPGAIDTDMTVYVQKETINPDLHQTFKKQRDTKTMLTTEQTIRKFVEILENRSFTSGDHIDYWD